MSKDVDNRFQIAACVVPIEVLSVYFGAQSWCEVLEAEGGRRGRSGWHSQGNKSSKSLVPQRILDELPGVRHVLPCSPLSSECRLFHRLACHFHCERSTSVSCSRNLPGSMHVCQRYYRPLHTNTKHTYAVSICISRKCPQNLVPQWTHDGPVGGSRLPDGCCFEKSRSKS
jgi:hypothetical protein